MKAPKLNRRAVRSLGRAIAHPGRLRGRKIGAALRERIILHVSAVNSCVVCSAVHERWGHAVGLDDADVRAAREIPPAGDLDDETRIALRYAELRTRGEEGDHPDDVARFEARFSPEQQREIRAVVDLFTFNNRFSNTWEAPLPGAHRRRRKMGLPDP